MATYIPNNRQTGEGDRRKIPKGDIDLTEIGGANSGADHVRYQGYRVDLRRPRSDVELRLYLGRRPELDSSVCDRSAFTAAITSRLEACSRRFERR